MLASTQIKFRERVVGDLRLQDRTFITHRTSAHLFRMFKNGLGISYDVIKNLRDQRCRRIIILLHFQTKGKIIGRCEICNEEYSETEKIETYPDFFLEKGENWLDGERDYQKIVPIEKLRANQMELGR